MLLLAVPAGLLGTWIVLRRLAFFTHAVGTASFPGAGRWRARGGSRRSWPRSRAALGFGVAQERLARTRRLARRRRDRAAARRRAGGRGRARLRRVRVRRGGRPAAVRLADRARATRDLWLTALVAAARRGARRRRCGGTGSATGFEPASARALGLRPVLADRLLLVGIAAAAVVALDAVGALLVTRRARRPRGHGAAADRPARRRCSSARSRSPRPRASPRSGSPTRSTSAPGPALAVLGGAVFAVVAVATAMRARAVAA